MWEFISREEGVEGIDVLDLNVYKMRKLLAEDKKEFWGSEK